MSMRKYEATLNIHTFFRPIIVQTPKLSKDVRSVPALLHCAAGRRSRIRRAILVKKKREIIFQNSPAVLKISANIYLLNDAQSSADARNPKYPIVRCRR